MIGTNSAQPLIWRRIDASRVAATQRALVEPHLDIHRPQASQMCRAASASCDA